jgi:hypothetical protein
MYSVKVWAFRHDLQNKQGAVISYIKEMVGATGWQSGKIDAPNIGVITKGNG